MEKDLKRLAVDYVEGRLFTHLEVNPDFESLGFHFLPILFGAFTREEAEGIGLIYEYRSEALPRALNGKPVFMTARYIKSADMPKFREFVENYQKLQKDFLS